MELHSVKGRADVAVGRVHYVLHSGGRQGGLRAAAQLLQSALEKCGGAGAEAAHTHTHTRTRTQVVSREVVSRETGCTSTSRKRATNSSKRFTRGHLEREVVFQEMSFRERERERERERGRFERERERERGRFEREREREVVSRERSL